MNQRTNQNTDLLALPDHFGTSDQVQVIQTEEKLPVEERSRRFAGLLGIVRLGVIGAFIVATIQIGGVLIAVCEAFLALIIYLAKEC